jgi:hypothetical protein
MVTVIEFCGGSHMISQEEESDTNRETLPEVPQVYNVMFRIRLCSVNPSQLPEVGHTSQGNSVTCNVLCTCFVK